MAVVSMEATSGNFLSFPLVICHRPFDLSHALIWVDQTRYFDPSKMETDVVRSDSLPEDMFDGLMVI